MHPSRLLPVLFLAILAQGCTVGRFFIYNFADTKDHRKFPARALPPSPEPFHYPVKAGAPVPRTATTDGRTVAFEEFLEAEHTVALLVIHRDTIVYERYFDGYDTARIHTSFSVAKSVVSMLVGCAINEGLIRSVDQPVTDFVPEMARQGWDKVTVEHVLQMTSGMRFNESYVNPFGTAARFYYGRTLRKNTIRLKLESAPGQRWDYDSGNTQLLGLILERSFRLAGDSTTTLTDYLERKLWRPLGMEYPASWSIDRSNEGMEKAFCCINTPARDFAKLGSLYLHGGLWRGEQLVPADWVERSTRIDTTSGSVARYQYQWWVPSPNGDFMAEGILGQYVYVDPAREIVIVRLGKKYGRTSWSQVFQSLAALYATPRTEAPENE